MRVLPQKLKEKQKEAKEKTIRLVQETIDDLQAEGVIVTRKLLIERTGLSNSVFSKGHVKQVLEKNRVCQFAIKRKLTKSCLNSTKDLELELAKAYKKIEKLEMILTDKSNVINKWKAAYYEMKEKNEILRGQLHILVQKAKMRGLDIEG